MSTVTPQQMLANADACMVQADRFLSDALDWLRSDWPPGTVLTDEQAERRTRMRQAAMRARVAIEEAQRT